jgi:DNA polymerase-3 subunit gamma/tau
LSLLDQALAYGNETLRDEDVAEMLGSLDRARVMTLLETLAAGDAASLLNRIREIDELVPDYAGLLDDLATVFQRLAVIQLVGPEALDEEEDATALTALAKRFDPEVTQLHYQIAVTSRRDLVQGPDPSIGFEMTMLRMLAFQPDRGLAAAAPGVDSTGNSRPDTQRTGAAAKAPEAAGLSGAADWAAFVQSLPLDGAARQLAMHTECTSLSAVELRLSVDRSNVHLLTEQQKSRLAAAILARLGGTIAVRFDVREAARDTAAVRDEQQTDEALRSARAAIEADPNVRELADMFGAELVADSIKPVTTGQGKAR